MLVIEPEVGTREAARILKCSQRKVQDLCDRGELCGDLDWWKPPGRGKEPKVYRITRSALGRYQMRQKEKERRAG